jgi:RNA polymerase sigma-70 factor (ECF subfamily)
MDDETIINLYWERSESAITETANKYGRYCQAIAFNILSNNADAEECENDTYMAAWNTIPPTRPN